MRGIIEGAAALLLSAILMAALPTDAEGMIYEDTVRLHILANSDSEEDQEVKLYVRNHLLSTYGEVLGGYASSEEAEAAVAALLPEIEQEVTALLHAQGFSYSARAAIGKEWYERREYADCVFPEGKYTSLRILLGEGEGKNWWCVMFPPMCLDMALGDTLPYSEEEKALIGGKYKWKLKSLEIAAKAFG